MFVFSFFTEGIQFIVRVKLERVSRSHSGKCYIGKDWSVSFQHFVVHKLQYTSRLVECRRNPPRFIHPSIHASIYTVYLYIYLAISIYLYICLYIYTCMSWWRRPQARPRWTLSRWGCGCGCPGCVGFLLFNTLFQNFFRSSPEFPGFHLNFTLLRPVSAARASARPAFEALHSTKGGAVETGCSDLDDAMN